LKNSRHDPEALKHRVRHWAERIGVAVKEIHVRPMRAKWASCSTAGRISLATAVLPLSRRFQDYIIVHELLHLRVPNHGKLWKSLIRAYVGDFEGIERRLAEFGDKQ
jgi:predicted metal-dependent hydrolase